MGSEPGRAPVLVGVGAITQREEPGKGGEAAALMAEALRRAADDAGTPALLRDADAVLVPRGMTPYADPGRLVADWIGAERARSVLFDVGVLQTSLFARAAGDIETGEAEVVLVTGGEAKFREQQAARAGGEAPITEQGDATPDEVLRPAAEILHPLELRHGLGMPVRQYAMMETALRSAEGLSVEAHRRRLGELYAAMNEVARHNPEAWDRTPVTADEIAFEGEGNRMLAFPYTKRHTSQWNVDQAAGLVFCSAQRADEAGVPPARRIHLRAVAESNHMVPLVKRRELHRSPGFALAGRAALASSGLAAEDLGPLELYSCFPVAVRIQARELGVDESRPLTVTGGMAFAGGPLNNFVLQAAVPMAQRLREEPGHGLLTAVSGLMTKQGVSVWSSQAGPESFRHEDVSGDAAQASPEVPVAPEGEGPARIVAHTLFFDREGRAESAVACLDLADGRRTLAATDEADWMEAMQREEWNGARVRVSDGKMRRA